MIKEVIIFIIGFIAGAAAAVIMRRKAKKQVEYKTNPDMKTNYVLSPDPISYEIK